MTKQLTLTNETFTTSKDGHTCGECQRIYKRSWTSGRHKRTVYKCPHKYKPRGFGYDLKKSHLACKNFLLRPTNEEIKNYER